MLAVAGWCVWDQLFSGSALFVAATHGTPAEVRAALAYGIPVDVRDRLGGGTALILAASSGGPHAAENIRTLLDHGADVNASNGFGNTALMLAAEKGHAEAVALLLQRGADVDATNNRGRTALQMAAKHGRAGIAGMLKRASARR
jgi:ankyrin repeat protein